MTTKCEFVVEPFLGMKFSRWDGLKLFIIISDRWGFNGNLPKGNLLKGCIIVVVMQNGCKNVRIVHVVVGVI